MHSKLTLCVLEVMPPQRPNLILTSDVPHSETNVLVLHRFHIETCHQINSHTSKMVQIVKNTIHNCTYINHGSERSVNPICLNVK